MLDLRGVFADFGGRVWLNCSHQGALPLRAAAAAAEAVGWKMRPWEMTGERFSEVPSRLRAALARLLGVDAQSLALTNGSSYGLHLLANGLELEAGDEVLLLADDFPSNLLPWQGLSERGVVTRVLAPREGAVWGAEDVGNALSPRTRVVCTSWVHSFSGGVTDLQRVGEVVRAHGALFVVNATQGLGVLPIALEELAIDALVGSGWKWLCGPYATGLLWLGERAQERLHYNQDYWLARQSADDLGAGSAPSTQRPTGARRYDLFGTANFFHFTAFAASLELLEGIGYARIAAHDQHLVQILLEGLDRSRYRVASPEAAGSRAGIVMLEHHQPERNRAIHAALAERGIHVALRRGRLRVTPHLYNREEDVQRLLEALAQLGT